MRTESVSRAASPSTVAVIPVSTQPPPIPASAGTAPVTRAVSTPSVPRHPLAGRTVVLNPGHNGGDFAAPQLINRPVPAGRGRVKACDTTGTATDSGYSEAAFNLAVARALRKLLVGQGARVVMTRTTNTGVGPCVNERAAIGNRARADAVLSIHADGGPADGRGFQLLYPPNAGETRPIYAASLRLAHALGGAILASRLLPPSTYAGRGGYSERYDLAGLNLSTRPAVFVELGNMRNSVDAALEMGGAGRGRLARTLLTGLDRYFGAR
jgi:N-acetylmuramoyl-L-alanine amidase